MLKNILRNFEWQRTADKFGPKRLLVFVINSESTRAVMFNRVGKKIEVEETLILPKWDPENIEQTIDAFRSDYGLEAHYCSVVVQNEKEQVRVLQIPRKELRQSNLDRNIYELMGIGNSHSLVYELEKTKKNTAMASVFAAAIPLENVEEIHHAVANAGYRPVSLVLSSTTVVNFLLCCFVKTDDYQSYFYIGDQTSTFIVFKDRVPILVRHFGIGFRNIITAICQEFGFDEDMALDTFLTNSFDFSSCMKNFTSWFHQLGISLDYVERRLGHSMKKLHVFGMGAHSYVLRDVLQDQVRRSVVALDLGLAFEQVVEGEAQENLDEFLPAVAEACNVMLGGLD